MLMAKEHLQLEKIFVYIAIIVGFLMIALEPPMTTPDENVHFLNAYGVSTGQIFPTNQNGTLTREFPQNLIEDAKNMSQRYGGNLEQKESFREWYYGSWLPVKQADSVRITYWGVDTNPVGYLFSGIAIALFRMILSFTSPELITPYNLIMAGKFGNLVFYVALCYFAVRKAPQYKRVLFLICLMPMTLYQAASLNYDAILFPTCFYLFSFLLNAVLKTDFVVTKKDILAVLGISVILAGIKQAYFFLLVILFAIPAKSFLSKKRHIGCIAAVITIFLLVYGGHSFIIRSLNAEPTAESLLMLEQLQYLKLHPTKIFSAIANSFLKYKAFYISGFVGILGQLDTNFPLLYHVLFWIVLFVVILADSMSNERLAPSVKILSVVGVMLTIISSFAGIYILWTSVTQGIGSDFVDGIQGRYFIPVFPFLVLLFSNVRFPRLACSHKIQKNTDELVAITGIIGALLTVAVLVLRFWV